MTSPKTKDKEYSLKKRIEILEQRVLFLKDKSEIEALKKSVNIVTPELTLTLEGSLTQNDVDVALIIFKKLKAERNGDTHNPMTA
ncbi:MAG: hypothetical protein ABIH25_01260 [Candidatus Woesearchaeota archaeon]